MNERLSEIDLFRGLKNQILNSFFINLISLIILFILVLHMIKNDKVNYLFITVIIILNLLPGFFYNYSQYSMNPNINLFSNDKKLIKEMNNNYKKIIISDRNFFKNNSIKKCQTEEREFEFENFSKIIPKFSIFYENIYLFLGKKNCFPKLRADFLSNNYQNIKYNYLHFDKTIEYQKINNEKFIIYNPKKTIYTNINFSKNWVAKSNQGQHDILNYKGKIKIVINSGNNISEMNLEYKNELMKFFIFSNLFIGFLFYFIFFLNLFRTFFLKRKLNHTELQN